VGKKKTKDVQFYSEVAEVSLALNQHKTHFGDSEEIEEEQRERQMRQRYINQYENFVKLVQAKCPQIEFDIPFHELGFFGAPNRSSVFLQPTSHCLVNLTESPFFVMSLEDVEFAFFERVSPDMVLKNFDIAFIFKDYSRPVVRVSSIPSDSLQGIKSWLNSVDIKYFEGVTPINWTKLLSHIVSHPDDFLEAGGWSMLDTNADNDESTDEEEDGDDNFGESDLSSSDSDDDYSMDSDESESEGSGSEGDSAMSDDDVIVGGDDDDDDDDDGMVDDDSRTGEPPSKAPRL